MVKSNKIPTTQNLLVYQTNSGALELKEDTKTETIWATQAQIATIFNVNSQAITKHIQNIYKDHELEINATCSKMEQVRIEGKRKIKRNIEHYNLDMIISIGYRVNSRTATQFRIWATKTLKQHITKGFTVNKKLLLKNQENFVSALNNINSILPTNSELETKQLLDLILYFANTWLNLQDFDKGETNFEKLTKKIVNITAEEFENDLQKLKNNLLKQNLATEFFATERQTGNLKSIFGNIFQSFDGQDLYSSIEEKAANLLYFVIKNHPFIDGNKRSGAFAFIWFLRKTGKLNLVKISPEALTAIAILIAESKMEDKSKMINLVVNLI